MVWRPLIDKVAVRTPRSNNATPPVVVTAMARPAEATTVDLSGRRLVGALRVGPAETIDIDKGYEVEVAVSTPKYNRSGVKASA